MQCVPSCASHGANGANASNAPKGSNRSGANPLGLCGVEFLEYTAKDTSFLQKLFEQMGIKRWVACKDKPLWLYGQGQVRFVVNGQSGTFAEQFHLKHGPSICSVGLNFKNAEESFEQALKRGAKAFEGGASLSGFPFPAIYGIGDSLIYFMDEKGRKKLYEGILPGAPQGDSSPDSSSAFRGIDHFTNNVPQGKMDQWCDFYERIFGFKETRFFDIRGEKTGLISKVMSSPCGQFAIPINEPTDDKSQITEYLEMYHGSGIQHVALKTGDILNSVSNLNQSGVRFLDNPPSTYYEVLKKRLPTLTEEVNQLESLGILADGDHKGYLLQIFTQNVIGPIFFEIIQRKEHDGFGEGNFQALFDAIERDQKRRGYLDA